MAILQFPVRQTHLQRPIKRIQHFRPLQVANIFGAQRQIVARLINRSPRQQ